MYSPSRFAEKYQLALHTAQEGKPGGGLCGFELEWNLLDDHFRPLLTVGSGPNRQSFVDYLRAECFSPWIREFSQLEVFHWMIEWATRPYYNPRGAVYEGRLMEAALINALHRAGRKFGERLYAWHGNLLSRVDISHDSIPGSWHLAKRRYLERCVDLYGETLATAGMHTNLSLPDPLFAWDFVHLSPSERGDHHLDEFKSEFYITATRLMRAFATLFIATSASTPLQVQTRDGEAVVVLTEIDSLRNLTFPNPAEIDLPDLYRSYQDYLRISYDLVRRGIRFGNNNWTPVRARSFAEPVERLIAITSEQLEQLHARGLYAAGQNQAVEEMASQIEVQNLLARINLPMARVEVRTDENGYSLEIDVANLTLKHLLMLRFYADPNFARAFRYDPEDISRARRNESLSARYGLRAEIENPFTAKPIPMREFLRWTLAELRPLAEALGCWSDLTPLVEMAAGAPNTSERLREHLRKDLDEGNVVPVELLRQMAQEREHQVNQDVERIAKEFPSLAQEAAKLGEFLGHARDEAHLDPHAPIRFRPPQLGLLEVTPADKTSEIVALASQLVRIPSVTVGPQERLEEVHRAATFIFDYLRGSGLDVHYFNESTYPALLAGFPGKRFTPVMLSGHFDVVAPEPDDSQFEPRLEGDYLWGRGAADMKTVVATYLVWMKDVLKRSHEFPPMNLLLVGNEENGEVDPMGTPHVLEYVKSSFSPVSPDDQGGGFSGIPGLLVAGERTGERGDELWGEICTQNRGVMRFNLVIHGTRAHSGATARPPDMTDRLFRAQQGVKAILETCLTIESKDGWHSQMSFPFVQVGTPGIYNVTADTGMIGVEVRPVPQDDLATLQLELQKYCDVQGFELQILVKENGIACDPENPYLRALVEAVRETSGRSPGLGRKLPGTSARFAPGGQGVVWGQSGIGPHARDERHYLPSILPYYQALDKFASILGQRTAAGAIPAPGE